MNRLMDKLVEMQMLVKSNNQYMLSANLQRTGYQLTVDDKNLYIASDANLLNQYKVKSKKANLNSDVMSDFKGKSGVGYVNIESILNGISLTGDARAANMLSKAKETFKDIKGSTDNFNGKYVEGHGELRFKNEKENSLTSLLGFVETVSKNVKRGTSMVGDPMDLEIDSVGGAARDGVTIDTVIEQKPAKTKRPNSR
jgi:hypothetical protein